MNEHQDIYVRVHTRRLKPKRKKSHSHQSPLKWADHALIFDCESRITADQSLTFGFWRFCELRQGRYIALEEGSLLDDNGELSDKEITVISQFAKRQKADTADDGYDHIRVYSRSKFLREVLGNSIQAKAFLVCFNAGFDFSRLAVDWTQAKNGGWSLIFFQWRNPKTRQLEPIKFFPRIVIKGLNSKTSIIHSTRPPLHERRTKDEKVKHWPGARFLDPRTLLWALRNRSYSLDSACEEFKTEHQKIDHTPTGKVTVKELEYARGDVACTVDLLNAVKQEFDLHPISAGPDRMFSSASVAKSYLEELNIFHPSKKV